MKNKSLLAPGSPRTLLTPSNEYKSCSEVRQFTNTEAKSSFSHHSPAMRPQRMDRLMEDNQQLIDQNTALLEEVSKLREAQPFLEEKVNILIVENERLTTLLSKFEQMEKDNRASKKRIAELLLKNKEQDKIIQVKDHLQARLEHTERIVCELDAQLSNQNNSEVQSLRQTNASLSREVQDNNEKIIHLVNSNDQLNTILEERLVQLENMNQMLQHQQEHYEQLLQKSLTNHTPELVSLKKENRSLAQLVQDLNTQLNRLQDEKSLLMKDKLSLQDQLSVLSSKDRASKSQQLKTQDSINTLQQELGWYKQELQRNNEEYSKQREQQDQAMSQLKEERDALSFQLQENYSALTDANYQIEQMKAMVKTSEDRILLLSDQIATLQSSAHSTAAYNEAIQHQQVGIYTNENQKLMQQTQQLCLHNQQLQYQIQQLTVQLESAHSQVIRQQQQISLQNQRFAQVQREWEAKEQIFTNETQSLIIRMQHLERERGLKDLSINQQDISLRSSMMDSPFKTLKLQNFYTKFDSENKEHTPSYLSA